LNCKIPESQLSKFKRVADQNFLENPLVNNYLQTGSRQAHKVSDFLSERQLHCLEGFYQQCLQPLGMEDQMVMILTVVSTSALGGKLHRNSQEHLVIGLHRSQRNFSERDRLVLNLLHPHLVQAYQNSQALTQRQQELAQLNRTLEQLSMIVLTADGNVRLITERAWILLTQYFQVSPTQKSSLPENLQRWINHQISLLNPEDDIPSANLPLHIELENNRLIIRFIADRLEAQYLLLLEEEPTRSFSPESLKLLGLTKREAEVLFWISMSKSNPEIANILGCSDKTVKKHLEHIYEKFEVKGRTAAIVYALERLGMQGCQHGVNLASMS